MPGSVGVRIDSGRGRVVHAGAGYRVRTRSHRETVSSRVLRDASDDSSARPRRPAPDWLVHAVAGGIDLCSDHSDCALRAQRGHGRLRGASLARHSVRRCAPTARVARDTAALRSGHSARRRRRAGGDGATLLPFELVLRSDDLGETWRSFELPEFDGERAYVAGSVVTSDGRLLSLLNNFSGDRRNRRRPFTTASTSARDPTGRRSRRWSPVLAAADADARTGGRR